MAPEKILFTRVDKIFKNVIELTDDLFYHDKQRCDYYNMYTRLQNFREIGRESCFLWGPRQTGKSTLLKQVFPNARYYDLLLAGEFNRFTRNPSILHEELMNADSKRPVIIDEVQLVPILLNEAQWFMVNRGIQFILCGSSARKIKRSRGNLLGGRAMRYRLYPLVSKEIPDLNLNKALHAGLLPRHYLAENPMALLQSYVGEYLKEEIIAEGFSRNIPAFSRFLESAAFSNGEVLNYANIASDCGVSAVTVKEYFRILTDTLLGSYAESFRKRPKRRVIHAPKFYFFDLGIPNFLLKRRSIEPGNEIFGKVFEHFIFQEISAHSHYSGIEYPIKYWRTASQLEVDFILGDHETALEVKGVEQVQPRHLRGLEAFMEEYKVRHAVVVSLDARPRKAGDIEILPWKIFLERLWSGEFVKGTG